MIHSRKHAPNALKFCTVCMALAHALSGSAQANTPADTPAAATSAATSATQDNGFVTSAAPTGTTLHLLVGRSISVETKTRLRKVYVGDPTILDSITESPTHIILSAKAPGSTTVVLSDEFGHSQVYLGIADLDVGALQNDLTATFPEGHLRAEAQQGRISVYGTVGNDASADAALKLAGLYSKDVANSLSVNPSHTQQVRLKVRILEVDRSKLNQFGINIFSGGNNIGSSTATQFPVTTSITSSQSSSGSSNAFSISDPLSFLFYNTNVNVGVAIRDLETRQILQILAEPNITTESGQKASFLSGGEFPFPVVQSSAGAFPTVTIQFRTYGVKLDFTPRVNGDGTIQLKVAPEVSALDYTNSVTISGFTVPALSTRRAETQVEVRNGQSFVISGLLDRRTTDILSKTPVLGQLPILGNLFSSKNINHSTVELVVLVTPTLIDPLNDPEKPVEPKLPVPLLDSKKFDSKTSVTTEGMKK